MTHRPHGRSARGAWIGFAGVAAALCALTLFPTAAPHEGPLISVGIVGYRGVADAVANVLLFVPLGVAAGYAMDGWRRPVLAGAALSLLIEVVQLAVPGRYTSPNDLLFNTLGTAAGVALLRWRELWLRPPRAVGVALGTAALTAALLVLAGGTFLFAPSATTARMHGVWRPLVVATPRYGGEVLDARVGGLAVTHGRIAESAALRRLLLDGPQFELRVEAGEHGGPYTPIFTIYDANMIGHMTVAAVGEDVIWRFRMRSTASHLDEPELELRGALAGIEPGEVFTVRGWRERRGYCLQVNERRECGLGFTVGDTWALLLYPVPRGLAVVLPYLWIGALLLPAGFWLRGTGSLLAVALTVAVLAAAPAHAGVLPTPVGQLTVAGAGILAGALLGRAFKRPSTRKLHGMAGNESSAQLPRPSGGVR